MEPHKITLLSQLAQLGADFARALKVLKELYDSPECREIETLRYVVSSAMGQLYMRYCDRLQTIRGKVTYYHGSEKTTYQLPERFDALVSRQLTWPDIVLVFELEDEPEGVRLPVSHGLAIMELFVIESNARRSANGIQD